MFAGSKNVRKLNQTKDELRDALNIAWSMLCVIEHGGSYDPSTWDERLAKIERALGENTPRSRIL